LSNASFSIPTIQKDPLGTAAGTLTIQTLNGTTSIWGGFLLVPDLECLQNVGIYAGGQVFIKLNTTSDLKQVTLQMASNTNYTLTLEPQAFSLFINGYADFQISGHQVFRLSGTLDVEITTDHLSMFVQAQLFLGGTVDAQNNLDNPILTFNANGLIYVQWATANGINPGFAAKITLTLGANVPSGISFGMNWLLVINTTGSNVTYFIPAPLPTSPPSPPVPTVMGPDYSSSNPLALTSYETITNGQRTLVIPNGPPAPGLSNYATWSPAQGEVNTPYFIVIGRGSVTLGTCFVLTGAINITATLGASGFDFSLQADATLNIMLNGSSVLSFQASGGIQISHDGVAAALSISYSEGFPGFTLSATFLLEMNTTGQTVTLAGITVPAGTLAKIYATGDLKFLNGVVDLSGSFDLTVSKTYLGLSVNANLTFFGATFTANGNATIYYDSHPGLVLSIQLGLPGGGGIEPIPALGNKFVITGGFTLQINTCSTARTVGGTSLPADYFHVAISNLGVYLFGFSLTGGLSITISSAGFSLDNLNLSLDFFGIVTLGFSGYFHANGSFGFTAYAGFSLGDSWFGVNGYVSVTISNTGFSATVGGSITLFHITFGASASITITAGQVDLTFRLGKLHHTFVIGHTRSPPAVATSTTPVSTSNPPALAGVTNGQLVLYLGQDAGSRTNSDNSISVGAQSSENYTLTRVSGDPDSSTGETIQIVALGYTEQFANVTSILVRNTRDSAGNTIEDTIQIDSAIAVPVNITVGGGSNTSSTITTGSGPATISVTGDGTNEIATGKSATITVSGNGDNTIIVNALNTTGGSVSITISGTGSNGVEIDGPCTGTITLASTATGANVIDCAGGSPTINVSGGGDNEVTVSSGSAETINVSGNGANEISALGAGSATINVSGNGANDIATGSGAATVYLIGSGDNEVDTGAGFATVYDEGRGANSVIGGSGGGLYIGGVDSTGRPYANKGTSNLETITGNFSANISGYIAYTLTDSGLTCGAYTLSLNGVTSVTLSAAYLGTLTENQFSLTGWSGSATLHGTGTNNTLTYSPASSVSSLNYVLTNSSLQVTGGLTQTITLSDIQTANLYGAAAGTNTYTVSNWTGLGSLTGPAGATNTVIAADDTDFTLSDTALDRANCVPLSLAGIQNATLSGGPSGNTFTASDWSGYASFDGEGGNDTYDLTLTGHGTGIFTVADSGPASGDTLNVNGGWTTFITSSQVKVGTQHITYSGIAAVVVTGVAMNVQSTNASVSTLVETTGGYDSNVNVGSVSNTLDGILGAVQIENATNTPNLNTLNLNDQGNTNGHSYTLSYDYALACEKLSRDGMAPITWQGVGTVSLNAGQGNEAINVLTTAASSNVVINGGSGNNVFTVQGTNATSAVIIYGGEGNDELVLGNAGNTGQVLGQTYFDGGAGTNTVTIDNSAAGVGDTGTLTLDDTTVMPYFQVSHPSVQMSRFGGLWYANVEELNIKLGLATTNVVDIDATGAGMQSVSILGTAGNESFNVGQSSSNPLSAIHGLVSLDGGPAGNDTLSIVESDFQPGLSFSSDRLTATTYTGQGMDGGITWNRISTLSLSLLGNTDLTIAAVPVAATTVTMGAGTDPHSVTVGNGHLGDAAGKAAFPINSSLTVTAEGGNYTMVFDDSLDAAPYVALLNASGLAINNGSWSLFSGFGEERVLLGSGGGTVIVLGAPAGLKLVSIIGGAGQDIVDVSAVPADTVLDVQGGAGDELSIAGAAALQATVGPVFFQGDTISINASDATTSYPLYLDQPATIPWPYTGASLAAIRGLGMNNGLFYTAKTINITLTPQADTVYLQATTPGTQSVTISGVKDTEGNDDFYVGGASALTNLYGKLTLVAGNGSGDRMWIVNQYNTADFDTGTSFDSVLSYDSILGAETFTGQGLHGTLAFSGFTDLGVFLGSGKNSLAIDAVPAGTSLQVNMGGGDDRLSVGYTHGLSALNMSVLGLTGGSNGQLIFSDVGDTSDHPSVLIQGGNIQGLTPGGGQIAIPNNSGWASIGLTLGSGTANITVIDDSTPGFWLPLTIQGTTGPVNVTVSSLQPNDSVTFYGGSADNNLYVGKASSSNDVSGTVKFFGSDGNDTAYVYELGSQGTVWFQGGAGEDALCADQLFTYTGGASGYTAEFIQGAVLFFGGKGTSNVVIRQTLVPTNANTVTFDSTVAPGYGQEMGHIGGLGMGQGIWYDAERVTVQLQGAPGSANQIYIDATAASLQTLTVVQGDAYEDQFHVGDTTATGSSLSGIHGTIVLDGGAGSYTDSLDIDNAKDPSDWSDITLTNTGFTGMGLPGAIVFSNITWVTVTLGTGANEISLESVPYMNFPEGYGRQHSYASINNVNVHDTIFETSPVADLSLSQEGYYWEVNGAPPVGIKVDSAQLTGTEPALPSQTVTIMAQPYVVGASQGSVTYSSESGSDFYYTWQATKSVSQDVTVYYQMGYGGGLKYAVKFSVDITNVPATVTVADQTIDEGGMPAFTITDPGMQVGETYTCQWQAVNAATGQTLPLAPFTWVSPYTANEQPPIALPVGTYQVTLFVTDSAA
ncbi:MAG: hypothetical protein ABSH34_22030, partial [Verrucomicrobiota bacterium]